MAAGTVLSASGMGLFLAGVVRSPEQQSAFGILFINATLMLGEVYWDLDFVSAPLRRIGYLTPQAWAIEGFKAVGRTCWNGYGAQRMMSNRIP